MPRGVKNAMNITDSSHINVVVANHSESADC